jgi:hypothetical protein
MVEVADAGDPFDNPDELALWGLVLCEQASRMLALERRRRMRVLP